MRKDALISGDGKYRYWLSRLWNIKLPLTVFIGLNPSTADAEKDDPTIRRCISFAKSWGSGGIIMLNLFAFRATDPKELLKIGNPVGPFNFETLALENWYKHWKLGDYVCCWGSNKMAKDISKQVLKLIKTPMCLGITKDGYPRHPLYLKKDLKPIRYKPQT